MRYPNDDGTLRAAWIMNSGTIKRHGLRGLLPIVIGISSTCAKSHGIALWDQGAGSAAGSIVAYCLKSTDIDPIRYQLLFERFLNPERYPYAPISTWISATSAVREVIDYVVGKVQGRTRWPQIVTFGTLAARGVIRDVGRVMDLPYSLCDQVSKMVPAELNITLDLALKKNPELKGVI